MYYYSIIGILAALILLIENLDIILMLNDSFKQRTWRVYRSFLFAVLFYYGTDIMWGLLEYYKLRTALYWDTVVYFIAMASGVALWTQFVVIYLDENNNFAKFLRSSGHIVAGITVAASVVNLFVPVLFSVDENSVYTPCLFRYVILTAQVVILVLISLYASVSYLRKKNGSAGLMRYRTVALFGVIMAIFLTTQLWFAYWPLYSMGYMLGTCLIRAFVISDEKEEYRNKYNETKEIRELKQTMTALLDNMPALSFTKDAATGVYLACNQAFAEYAHKKNPSEVIGLTDSDIFDKELAIHFAQDDSMVLSMDRPYVFYEDVTDAVGNPKQFQTTKLKYFDASGKLCILGMSEDVTDMVRIQRESVINQEAYEKARSMGVIYTHIAQTLARGYENLYYVNTETEEFIEYYTDPESEQLIEKRRGDHFFDQSREDIKTLVYHEDVDLVLKGLDRDNLLKTLDENKSFIITYRINTDDEPLYVTLKASRMEDDEKFVILGITNVDDEVKQRRQAERARDERKAYNRLNALAGDFIAIYVVDPETEHYHEYSSSSGYRAFEVPADGEEFFASAKENGKKVVYPEDFEKYLSAFNKETVLFEIEQNGLFMLSYRIVLNGKPRYCQLRAAKVYEDDVTLLVIGVNDVDKSVRHEQEYARRLRQAQVQANVDALTGVKNLRAYQEDEAELNALIADGMEPEFALVVLDVNDLKKVNDLEGHQAGDKYLCGAVKIICDIFKHSPVFRTGGDEFAVILRGEDYYNAEMLMGRMRDHNQRAKHEGGIVVACGMTRYDNDGLVSSVFERADSEMYENKAALKGSRKA